MTVAMVTDDRMRADPPRSPRSRYRWFLANTSTSVMVTMGNAFCSTDQMAPLSTGCPVTQSLKASTAYRPRNAEATSMATSAPTENMRRR